VKGSVYCKPHKKIYECIYRQSMKDPNSEDYTNYIKVFGPQGTIPNDVALCNKVILDFEMEFPEGKERKPREPRGVVVWTRYVKTEGARQSAEDEAHHNKWDIELFVNHMKFLRGWDVKKCNETWEMLKADPDISRDEGGLPPNKPSLYIPPNYTGADSFKQAKGTYEDQAVTMESKAIKNMDAEAKLKLKKECRTGFGKNPVDGIVAHQGVL